MSEGTLGLKSAILMDISPHKLYVLLSHLHVCLSTCLWQVIVYVHTRPLSCVCDRGATSLFTLVHLGLKQEARVAKTGNVCMTFLRYRCQYQPKGVLYCVPITICGQVHV